MSDISTAKTSKKTIQINQDFFKIGKKNNSPIVKTKKNKPKIKPVANNTIKQALARRVQERKQKDLDEIHQRRSTLAASVIPTETELSKSLSYLSEFVKNKKKRNDPSKRRANKTTLKAQREPIVNVELPDELMTTIMPAPMKSLVPTTAAPIHVPSLPKPISSAITPPATKYTYVTEAPPYSNLKNSSGGKPSYRVWKHTRKQHKGGANTSTSNRINIPAPITPINTGLSDREQRLAAAKRAVTAVSQPKPTGVPISSTQPVVIPSTPTNAPAAVSIPRTRIIKKTIKNKYTVGRKIGGRKVSVLIKNLKTRRKVQEAKKELKKTNTTDIKKYLKSHGLLKGGSVAPNNVLREMYESAMMSGDIHNTNGEVALHNFNTDEI